MLCRFLVIANSPVVPCQIMMTCRYTFIVRNGLRILKCRSRAGKRFFKIAAFKVNPAQVIQRISFPLRGLNLAIELQRLMMAEDRFLVRSEPFQGSPSEGIDFSKLFWSAITQTILVLICTGEVHLGILVIMTL